MDFRVAGTDNEALAAFCKTLPDTGCGYYPNGGFVHMDVRSTGSGHVAWTDVSHPGEPARYVASMTAEMPARGRSELPSLPGDGSKEKEKGKGARAIESADRTDGRAHQL